MYLNNYESKIGQIIAKNQYEGFLMVSKTKPIYIRQNQISNLNIVNKTLAHKPASQKARAYYEKVINYLTDLLISDDEEGESARIALNEIEKFRMQIKIKYRNFLTKEELEKMSKQLKILQNEAKLKLLEINNNLIEENQNSRKCAK